MAVDMRTVVLGRLEASALRQADTAATLQRWCMPRALREWRTRLMCADSESAYFLQRIAALRDTRAPLS